MNSGLHSHQFLKTCGLLFCKPRSHRHIVSFVGRQTTKPNVPVTCLTPRRHSPVILQLWRLMNSAAPTMAVPVMKEPDLKDELLRMPREAHQVNVGEEDGWLNIGQYSVFAWSVSGSESCIVVKSEDVILAFDMGVAVSESVRAPNVFITHGHVDHIGGVANHVAKRGLVGMKSARYFVPPHLVQPLFSVMRAHYEMAQTTESLDNVNIMPLAAGDTVRLSSRYFVKAFPTIHRIPSQGYIVYKEEKKLKEEYRGLEGFQVAALHREGKEIHDIIITPEIAYCGDTVFDIFVNPPNPDLLKVKLLITEATFLDDDIGKNMVQKAKDRGHTHLLEIAQNAELFRDVGHMILVHFSNKYSPRYIRDCIRDKLPSELRGKVTPATVAKATVASTGSSR